MGARTRSCIAAGGPGRDPSLARPHRDGSARSASVPRLELSRPRLVGLPVSPDGNTGRREDPAPRSHKLRCRASRPGAPQRHPHRLEPGLLLAARPPAGGAHDGGLPDAWGSADRLWNFGRRAPERPLARGPGAAHRRIAHLVADEVPPLHRGSRRLGAFPGGATRRPAGRGPLRGVHRECRRALRAGTARGGRGDRGGPTRRKEPSGGQPAPLRFLPRRTFAGGAHRGLRLVSTPSRETAATNTGAPPTSPPRGICTTT